MAKKYSFPKERFIHIGTVTKAQGLRGEVVITTFSGQPHSFKDYSTLVLVDDAGTLSPALTVERLRIHKGKVIIKFDRVGDRTFAENLVGMGVLLTREDLPATKEDEYYWDEITGLTVLTADGKFIGKVVSLFSNGAQDIMVISDDTHEYLVPLTDDFVTEQNDTEIIIHPPPGLLQINGDEK